MQHTASHVNTCTHCNTLQHTSSHCNKLYMRYTASLMQVPMLVAASAHLPPPSATTHLQRTTIHGNTCNTLHHTSTNCNTHQRTATRCPYDMAYRSCRSQCALPLVPAVCCSELLQCVAVYCRVLRCVAVCCFATSACNDTLQHTTTHYNTCNALHHTSTHCNILQHTATHCNTLQHTATHCNTSYLRYVA